MGVQTKHLLGVSKDLLGGPHARRFGDTCLAVFNGWSSRFSAYWVGDNEHTVHMVICATRDPLPTSDLRHLVSARLRACWTLDFILIAMVLGIFAFLWSGSIQKLLLLPQSSQDTAITRAFPCTRRIMENHQCLQAAQRPGQGRGKESRRRLMNGQGLSMSAIVSVLT